MGEHQDKQSQVEDKLDDLIDNPNLADALESDQFKQFLDQVPIAIAVAELEPEERLVYANLEFERIAGVSAERITGNRWDVLNDVGSAVEDGVPLGIAVIAGHDHLGTFVFSNGECARKHLVKCDRG
ncbi:PAS domain-containing protein [Novosphingobium resinovorum]